MAEKKKINWLLILQGWAMLWVVIGHSFLGEPGKGPEWENILYNTAYSFHMPLFMLVSGWLFYLTRLLEGKWTYPAIISDKSVRLLLPGFVFSLVAFSVKIVFPGEMTRPTGYSLQDILHAYLFPNDNPLRELWFIATLFWFFLLVPLWKYVLNRRWAMWGMLAILVGLHFIKLNVDLLCLDRVVNYSVWFYMGLVVSKEKYVEALIKYPWHVLLVGMCVWLLGQYTIPFIVTIGCMTVSLALALLADRYVPRLLFSFRNYTYQIFLMGIFAQVFVKIIYRHVEMPYVAAFVLCVVMGLYVPVLVSKCVEAINWHPLCLCVGLKGRKA